MIKQFLAKVTHVISSPNTLEAKEVGGPIGYPAVGSIKYEIIGDDFNHSGGSTTYARPANPRIIDLPVVDENQIQYTVPPWSRTKPNETPVSLPVLEST